MALDKNNEEFIYSDGNSFFEEFDNDSFVTNKNNDNVLELFLH